MATTSLAFGLTAVPNAFEDIWPGAADGPTAIASDEAQPVAAAFNATFAADHWDTAFINGEQLPGTCELSDGNTELFVDHPKPDGKDGGVLILKGKKPSDFQITVTIWTRPQWLVMQQRIGQFWRATYKAAKSPPAIQVDHPGLAIYGIRRAVLVGIGFPRPGPFDGSKSFVLKFREDMPPGKKLVTQKAHDPKVAIQLRMDKSDAPANETPTPPSRVPGNVSLAGPKAKAVP